MSEPETTQTEHIPVDQMPLGERPEDYHKLDLNSQIGVNTAAGDLRDVLFRIITQGALRKRAWDDCREEAKVSILEELSDAVNAALVHICKVVDSRGIPIVTGILTEIKLFPKLTMKITITESEEAARNLLAMRGEAVMALTASAWNARGERGRPRIAPDQGDIFNADAPAKAAGEPDIEVINEQLNGAEGDEPEDGDDDAAALARYEAEAAEREATGPGIAPGVRKTRGRRRTAH